MLQLKLQSIHWHDRFPMLNFWLRSIVNQSKVYRLHIQNIGSVKIEKVEIDSTIAGQQYSIVVSHKGTLERGSQAYSLVISGAGGTAYCASAPTIGDQNLADQSSRLGVLYFLTSFLFDSNHWARS